MDKRFLIQFLMRFLIQLVKAIALYVLLVVGGTIVILLVSLAVGYLPYSDRPGPGWYKAHIPTWGMVRYFLAWSKLFFPQAAIAGTLLSVQAIALRCLRAPRWLVPLSGSLTASSFSFLLVAAAGWYISIAGFAIASAGFLGLVFGAVGLPILTEPISVRKPPTFRHWLGISAVLALMIGEAVWPWLQFSIRLKTGV